MEVDIYGDLDNFDSQFELVRKENEQMKDTIEKLEETSIKFSIEINELKRINTNLEVNISTLFKTAKAEIERKNKQISELRKDLDNMLFKRDPKRKMPDKDSDLQEKQNLTKQFEKVQCELEQKNRIIKKLDIELHTVRKELEAKARDNTSKRHLSLINEDNDYHSRVKKPRLDGEKIVENEEVYRNYTNRRGMNENDYYSSRSKSPEYRKFSSRGRNDLRSRIDFKTHKYERSASGSRDTFKSNNRLSRHRNAPFRGRYPKSGSPAEYGQCYRYNKANDKSQKYFPEYNEYDNGVYNSQANENSYNYENYDNEPEFSDSPSSSNREEGELDNSYVAMEDSKYKKELGDHKNILHIRKSITPKTTLSTSADSHSSKIKNKISVTETVINIKPTADKTNIYNALSSDEEIKTEIKEAIVNLCTDDIKLEEDIEESKFPVEIKKLRQRRQSTSTKSTLSSALGLQTSMIRNEKVVTETVTNMLVDNESKLTDVIISDKQERCNLSDILKQDEKEVQFSKNKMKNSNDPRIQKLVENSESKLPEKKKENYSTNPDNSLKVKNITTTKEKEVANSKTNNAKQEEMTDEFILNDVWEVIGITENSNNQENKSTTYINERKLESKSTRDKEEKSKSDKPIQQNSVLDQDSESKSKMKDENFHFDVGNESALKTKIEKSVSVKDAESKLKSIEKSVLVHSSEAKLTKEKDKASIKKGSKSTKNKNEEMVKLAETSSKSVLSNTPKEIKIEKKNSKTEDTNILIVSELNLGKTKRDEKVTESCDSNISNVSEINSTKIKKKKEIPESIDTNISIVSVSAESKVIKQNLKTDEDSDKNISDILKPNIEKKLEETIIPQSDSTLILPLNNTKFQSKDCTNVNQTETHISKERGINLTETNVENSVASTEMQNIQTSATQENDRKPPIRGRRRRCIISIT